MSKEIKKMEKAGIGSIVPIYRDMPMGQCAVEYFARLSNYGREENAMLLESADIVKKYGEQSIGSSDPCLKVIGKKENFEIIALNKLGERFLSFIEGRLDFCDEVEYGTNKIQGKLRPVRGDFSEEERLNLKTHADILRTVAFAFKPTEKPIVPYGGLFGNISYDFIDQFEDLPKNKSMLLDEPDYEMNYYDSVFTIDHKKKKITFIANALLMDDDYGGILADCLKRIEIYEKAINKKIPAAKKPKLKNLTISTDTPKKKFEEIVKKMKKHIVMGDVFQVVPSRTIISSYDAEPLDIYRDLRRLNPSPYMFYMNFSSGILVGSSPEMFLKVEGGDKKKLEIRPIAGTKPRGIINGKIDADLDSRYETELKLDAKELAEHTMLIDLARNDVARVSEPGTRVADRPYEVEKYSHVQHLVSNVSGILRKDLDAMHAYLASMNMGTLTGAPKVEAMKLIRKYENNKRGFYGGSVGYLTPSGDFDSCICIRSMRLKNGKAYVRAGAGIVYDSIPEKEFDESNKKARACLKAIELAQEVNGND
ncbi:MAG: anthranilate synthase component 1 [Candidatus Diapherotrites archaeon]